VTPRKNVTPTTQSIREQMDALGITEQELGELVGIEPGRIKAMLDGGAATPDELVKMRILKGNIRAHLDRLRGRYTTTWQGEGRGQFFVPYGGGNTGRDGGLPE
jgi:hypothetical protein